MRIERLRTLKDERNHKEAFRVYRELVALGEATAEAHLLGGQSAKAMGNHFAARYALEQALAASPRGTILGTTRLVYGIVLREMGEVLTAIEAFTTWMDEVHEYRELTPLMLGPVLYNRALAFRQAKRYSESIQDYVAACEEFRHEGMRQYLCMALHNLAWVSCVIEDPKEARKALSEALPLCNTEYLHWHQRIGEAYLEYVSEESNSRRVLAVCEEIVRCEDHIPPDVRSHACWLAGRIGFELGEIEAAEGLATQAITLGIEANNDNRCMYDAADLLRAIRHRQLQMNTPHKEQPDW